MTSQREEKANHKVTILIKWNSLRLGSFNLNINEVVKDNPRLGGLDGVFRDYNGNWSVGFNTKVP